VRREHYGETTYFLHRVLTNVLLCRGHVPDCRSLKQQSMIPPVAIKVQKSSQP